MPGAQGLAEGQVRVAVAAVGLNRADVLQRKGQYPAPPGYPADIPGLEFAGIVDAVGAGAGWRVGDRVMGITGGGAMAQFVVVGGDELLPVPLHMSMAQAASIPEAFITAWDAIVAQGGMRAGDAVLVHAAASGVGLAALALVESLGGRAIATTRSPDKAQQLRARHPNAAVIEVAKGQGFAAEVRAAAPQGVTVILDCVGAAYFDDNLSVIATGGRWLLIGFLGGSRKEVSLVPFLMKKIALIGSTLRSRDVGQRAATAAAFTREVLPKLASGAVSLPPVQVRSIDELAAAQLDMEADANVGKIVLTLWPVS